MSGVVVVATFVVQPERVNEMVGRFQREVIEPTHDEEGCVKYALHRSTADPNTFVLVEQWRSQEDLDAHFQRPHMAMLGELMGALAEPASIHFLHPVPTGGSGKGVL